jgi:CheY-like chemotaxis protein
VPLAGQTVIAIDNEPRILEGLRALLEGWGCVVVTAASLDEAVAVLTARDVVPNVVLADYHLDDADGIAAITALRERFGNDLPALLATADRSRELRAQATSLDIRVLNKPMKPAQLRSLLSQWHTLRRAAE